MPADPITYAVRDMRINHAGCFRCCVGSLAEWLAEQGDDTRIEEGTTFSCFHCEASMILDLGVWRWDREDES